MFVEAGRAATTERVGAPEDHLAIPRKADGNVWHKDRRTDRRNGKQEGKAKPRTISTGRNKP